MKLSHLFVAVALMFSASAFAAHCPMDMKKIDAALAQGTSLSADDLAKVKALRAQGEAMHKSGKHGESVEKLGEAMRMLGID